MGHLVGHGRSASLNIPCETGQEVITKNRTTHIAYIYIALFFCQGAQLLCGQPRNAATGVVFACSMFLGGFAAC